MKKPSFADLIKYMVSGPTVPMVWKAMSAMTSSAAMGQDRLEDRMKDWHRLRLVPIEEGFPEEVTATVDVAAAKNITRDNSTC